MNGSSLNRALLTVLLTDRPALGACLARRFGTPRPEGRVTGLITAQINHRYYPAAAEQLDPPRQNSCAAVPCQRDPAEAEPAACREQRCLSLP